MGLPIDRALVAFGEERRCTARTGRLCTGPRGTWSDVTRLGVDHDATAAVEETIPTIIGTTPSSMNDGSTQAPSGSMSRTPSRSAASRAAERAQLFRRDLAADNMQPIGEEVTVRRIVMILGAMIAAGLAIVSAPAMAQHASTVDVHTEEGTSPDSCLRFDENGEQVWDGQASAELDLLANEVQALVDEHTDVATGVAFCSGFDGVAVFMTPTAGALAERIDGIAAGKPYPVIAYEVPASLDTLISAGQSVMERDLSDAVMGFAPDIYSGALLIEVRPGSDQGEVAARVQRELDRTEYSAVQIVTDPGGEGETLVTRKADTAPYWMGGELVSASGYCSSGVRITFAGVHRLLTAGHCTATSFTNAGNLVGNQYTTAYPGNADIYGDWKLLYGSTYGMRVFNGDVYGTTSLAISGAVWGGRPNGSAVCTSGRTTGQICRYYVTNSYSTRTVDGIVTGQMLEMRHDSTGGSGADWNGAQPGDSGGTCYYSDGAGGVTVAGIVTARFSTPSLRYYCTQLSGVRAWPGGTGATVG